MKISLFLGAGASVPFQKPTTLEFKRRFTRDSYGNSRKDPRLRDAILNHHEYPDIEHVLQALREIREFENSKGGKFITWLGDGLLFRYSNSHTVKYDELVRSEITPLENEIKKAVFDYYRWDSSVNATLRKIYDSIFNMIIKYQKDIHVFTTNYDIAIEEYCGITNEHKCIDGFVYNNRKRRHLWANGVMNPPDHDRGRDVYLYKLHGSLNWKYHSDHGLERTSEESQINDPSYTDNLLVYPTMNPKDGHEKDPYKTIRKHFVKQMNASEACIVIGFSFRDLHINEVMIDFIKKKKPLIVISPSAVEDVCSSLLSIDIPKYDENRLEVQIPKFPNIWCINQKIDPNNINHIIEKTESMFLSVQSNNKISL